MHFHPKTLKVNYDLNHDLVSLLKPQSIVDAKNKVSAVFRVIGIYNFTFNTKNNASEF
jgi:hypothetical protein